MTISARDTALRAPRWKKRQGKAQSLRVAKSPQQGVTLKASDGKQLPMKRVRVLEVRNGDDGTMRLVAEDEHEEVELLTQLTPEQARKVKEAIDDFVE